jgi:hypothetical protein
MVASGVETAAVWDQVIRSRSRSLVYLLALSCFWDGFGLVMLSVGLDPGLAHGRGEPSTTFGTVGLVIGATAAGLGFVVILTMTYLIPGQRWSLRGSPSIRLWLLLFGGVTPARRQLGWSRRCAAGYIVLTMAGFATGAAVLAA